MAYNPPGTNIKKFCFILLFCGGFISVLVILIQDPLQHHRLWACPDPCPLPGAGTFTPVPVKRTALISFPGSGNTWARHLLTTSTGLLTGSVYLHPLAVSISSNGNGKAARVVAVKTHLAPAATRAKFLLDRGILLIRNPYEAILAEFNRQGRGNQTGIRTAQSFLKGWPKHVQNNMGGWKNLHLAWAKDNTSLHVLVYHRMVAHLEQELHNTLQFLNLSFVTPRIHCAVRKPEGYAHRKKPDWVEEMAVFSRTQRQSLNAAIDSVRKALLKKTGVDFADMDQWKR
ncbi:WSCD family member CG9164-like [Littorina saxatilis]|uniref:WSCD family member CG9164-like n=1 Tax=Littorina saxatilis TaxID=31220 RepID=UPI0038B47137